MELEQAKQFLTARAKELGFEGTIKFEQPDFLGAGAFLGVYPDGTLVHLGTSLQDAEGMLKKLTGRHEYKPRPQPVEVEKQAPRRKKS